MAAITILPFPVLDELFTQVFVNADRILRGLPSPRYAHTGEIAVLEDRERNAGRLKRSYHDQPFCKTENVYVLIFRELTLTLGLDALPRAIVENIVHLAMRKIMRKLDWNSYAKYDIVDQVKLLPVLDGRLASQLPLCLRAVHDTKEPEAPYVMRVLMCTFPEHLELLLRCCNKAYNRVLQEARLRTGQQVPTYAALRQDPEVRQVARTLFFEVRSRHTWYSHDGIHFHSRMSLTRLSWQLYGLVSAIFMAESALGLLEVLNGIKTLEVKSRLSAERSGMKRRSYSLSPHMANSQSSPEQDAERSTQTRRRRAKSAPADIEAQTQLTEAKMRPDHGTESIPPLQALRASNLKPYYKKWEFMGLIEKDQALAERMERAVSPANSFVEANPLDQLWPADL